MHNMWYKTQTSFANCRFNGDLVPCFEFHVSNSVILYKEGYDFIRKISDFFISDDSNCYEIGCLTSSLLKIIDERNSKNNVLYIKIDN